MNTLMFDLDGTLLPMDQNEFIHEYFSLLGAKAASIGLDPKIAVKAVWAGTSDMTKNNGPFSNRDCFWKTFCSLVDRKREEVEPVFDRFYENEFNLVEKVVKKSPCPNQIVQCAKEKGYRRLLATNPLFPTVATLARIRWAGLNPDDFEVITTYENTSCCKPNPVYYQRLIRQFHLTPEDTMMIGNDVSEDVLPAKVLKMHTYLVTDFMIDATDGIMQPENKGSLRDLLEYVQSLPDLTKNPA